MQYPNRIKEHRERLGWSQDRLASAMDTTPQQVSRLEKGERHLNDKWLHRLSMALNVRQADLLVESGLHSSQPSDGDFVKDDTERRLLGFWRSLSDEAQDIILTVVTAWADRLIKGRDRR